MSDISLTPASVKRERAPDFSSEDVQILLSFVKENKAELLCKDATPSASKRKRDLWNEIEFKLSSAEFVRSWTQVRVCYDLLMSSRGEKTKSDQELLSGTRSSSTSKFRHRQIVFQDIEKLENSIALEKTSSNKFKIIVHIKRIRLIEKDSLAPNGFLNNVVR